MATLHTVDDIIARWKSSEAFDQSDSVGFLTELCDAIDLPRPRPAHSIGEENTYSFEHKVRVSNVGESSDTRAVDLYRSGCFMLESVGKNPGNSLLVADDYCASSRTSSPPDRESIAWEIAMQRAKRRAELCVISLPSSETPPIFLIIVDVGYCFDIYSDFSRSGGPYLHYPHPQKHRIKLVDFAKPSVIELFRGIWTDPASLDPSLRAAKVTELVADQFAALARMLEDNGRDPMRVAKLLIDCVVDMLTRNLARNPGENSPELRLESSNDIYSQLLSPGTFDYSAVLPLDTKHLRVLSEIAASDWTTVEPSLLGTLLERALDPKERHKLGAHYTPRAFVERLIDPTLMDPLRSEWEDVQIVAHLALMGGDLAEAVQILRKFRRRLGSIHVLDPACGSGNFLYVAMEHMKRLEAEVLHALAAHGDESAEFSEISPHQFLGIEVHPLAARIAEMVLWIGHLQSHFRTHGLHSHLPPLATKHGNIRHRDALLDWSRSTALEPSTTNPNGCITDANAMRSSQTGISTPNVRSVDFCDGNDPPVATKWPKADFIVGNPPFIGGKDKQRVLGRRYFDTLLAAYPMLPDSCDLVMYWWHKAAQLARSGEIKRFGFITTNSISQVFNRRVLSLHMESKTPLRLVFAVPDHPWVDDSNGAAVRTAMTVAEKGTGAGVLAIVEESRDAARATSVTLRRQIGSIHANLHLGADVTKAVALKSNSGLCSRGVPLHGSGFIVSAKQAEMLGLGRVSGLDQHIRHYRNGKDLASKPRGVMVIDLHGLTSEEVRQKFPEVYDWVHARIKPHRDQNPIAFRRTNWWLFGGKNTQLRASLSGLDRYISTVETSKHRFFVFLSSGILPDHSLVNIGIADAFHLGVLSSRIHVLWALATGGRLVDRPRYLKSVSFDTFPFPNATSCQIERIREIAERLDAHRKSRQGLHPEVTMTGMYNVLDVLRSGRELSSAEAALGRCSRVDVLRELHDELDVAVFEAYGWPVDLSDQGVLVRVVGLNAERAAEESRGCVRWLRREFRYGTESVQKRR
ncbi:MAG: hypothetical protein FWD57_01165 [Polyangiaceae bacterium]|nr:hypothetical protein [Polyangiaceae bacterium]